MINIKIHGAITTFIHPPLRGGAFNMISMVYSLEYIKHETGDHPENMERLQVIVESLEKKGS